MRLKDINGKVVDTVEDPFPRPVGSTAYFSISPADLDKIRAMVRDEVGNALRELAHELKVNPANY